MMGRLNHDQGEFFCSFRLNEPFRTITQFERLLRFSIFLGCTQSQWTKSDISIRLGILWQTRMCDCEECMSEPTFN